MRPTRVGKCLDGKDARKGEQHVRDQEQSHYDGPNSRPFVGMAVGSVIKRRSDLTSLKPNMCINGTSSISRIACMTMPKMPLANGKVNMDAGL